MNMVGVVIVLLLMTTLSGGLVAYYSFWTGFDEGYKAGYEERKLDELRVES